MKASQFELRHPDLLRAIVFGAAVAAYVFDRNDIVWSYLHWHTRAEIVPARIIFFASAAFAGLAAGIWTWSRACDGQCYQVLEGGSIRGAGPWRHVRHPWLIANAFLLAAVGTLLSRTGLIIAATGVSVLCVRLILAKEFQFERELGSVRFTELIRRVPLAIPSLRPSVPYARRASHWGDAFRHEIAHWGYFATLIVFAITLRDAVAWSLAGASLLVGIVFNSLRTSRTRSKAIAQLCAALFLIPLGAGSTAAAQDATAPAESADGEHQFEIRCSACHSIGPQMKLGPGLQGILREKRMTEEQVRNIVRHGVKTMPPLGDKINDKELDVLIEYLKTL